MAVLCVYRARYFNTIAGPFVGRLAYTTQSVRTVLESRRLNCSQSPRTASFPGKRRRPRRKAVRTEPAQELAPEHTAEDADWEEEMITADDPTTLVGRQPAAGDDAMDMRVQREVLTPGVQHWSCALFPF